MSTVWSGTGPTLAIRRHLLAALVAGAFLVLCVGGWAATAQLSGAVIAPGLLVVDSDAKKVQHPSGGVVAALNVRNGDTVTAGDVLIRLDDTVTRANLAIVVKSLDETEARLARLEAERDGAAAVTFPADLVRRGSEPDVARLTVGEANLFRLRAEARAGQKAQLAKRTEQLDEEGQGLARQIDAKGREIGLIQDELVGVRALYAKKLIQISRLTELEREAARLDGERGQLIASAAQTRGRTSEVALQSIGIDQDLRSEVATELRDLQAKAAELAERKIAAEDQLRRIDIRAPQDGRVHELAVHTVGGVIGAGEVLMLVVPVDDALRVEAKVAPQDIDQVRVGQRTALRFSAFNQRTTPEVDGTVAQVSPDLVVDPRTGAGAYVVRIALGEDGERRLGGLPLSPGMPVEAFIRTGERTALSYLMKPLADQAERSFRAD